MKKRFSEREIEIILDRSQGISVAEVCRVHGIHRRTFYKWQQRTSAAAQEGRLQASLQRRQTRTEGDQKLLCETITKRPHASSFEIVKHLIEVHSLPIARACRIVGIPRRTWYRWHSLKHVRELTPELAAVCRTMVFRAAKKWNLPPVYVTAHIRKPGADNARKEVMRALIVKYGLSRRLVASIFVRDLRRVRESVLGV